MVGVSSGESFDVVIIGAGINGLSAAFHIAQREVGNIIVLDKGQIGAGATGRSGGIVRAHYSGDDESMLALEGLRWYREWNGLVGGECGFAEVGLTVIVPPDREAQLAASIDRQRPLGVNCQLLTAEEARAVDPALSLPESVTHVGYEPGAGTVDPNLAVRSLVDAARRLGVVVRPGVEVTDIVSVRGSVDGVVTSGGLIRANTVVVAAGAWANPLLGRLGIELNLRPARARVAVFQAPPARSWPHPVCMDNVSGSWYRPVSGGGTLVGIESAVDRYPPVIDTPGSVGDEFISRAAQVMAERFPVMDGSAFRGGWSGVFMESPDQRPIIGHLAPHRGLFGVLGDSGTSFKTAPAIGLGMSELIIDGQARSVDLVPFRPDRFGAREHHLEPSGYTSEPGTVSR